MGGPTVLAAGAGELIGDSPDRRVEILCEHDALHATWSRFGPRRAGADLHVHRRHTDVFYVLAPPAGGGRPAAEALIGGAGLVAELPAMRVALRSDDEELGIAETSCDGRGATAEHVHDRHSESLYVLEGELALVAGGRELKAPAGSWVQVPAGVPHAVRFAAPVRFLDVHAPSRGFGAFLRALRETDDEELAATRSGFDQRPAG